MNRTRLLAGVLLAPLTLGLGCADVQTSRLELGDEPSPAAASGAAPDLAAPSSGLGQGDWRPVTGAGDMPFDIARAPGVTGGLPGAQDPAIDPPVDEPGIPLQPGTVFQRGQLRTTFGGTARATNVAENMHRGGELSFHFEGLRLVDADGDELELIVADDVQGVDEGDLLRFADVVPGADLTFLPRVHRLQQVLVLYDTGGILNEADRDLFVEVVDTIAVPADYELLHVFGDRRDTHAFPVELEAQGELVFVAEDPATGEPRVRFAVPEPVAFEDPEMLAADGQAPRQLRVTNFVRIDADGHGEIVTRIAAADLLAPDTVFPVYIDPDLILREGVTIASMQLAPTRSQSCDTVFAGVYGNFTNKPLNVFTEWSDGPTTAEVSRLQKYEIREFDDAACPGNYEMTFRVCDDKVPAECDEATLPVHPGNTSALPQNDCDFRCHDGVAFSFSSMSYMECVRKMAEVCADNEGRLEPSPECSPLTINELRYRGPGDDDETGFIELAGPPGMPLDGWYLEQRNGNDGLVVAGAEGWAPLGGNVGADGLYTVCAPDAEYFATTLLAANQVAPTPSTADGLCSVRVSSDETELEVMCMHDVANPTVAHIHIGAPGTNGGVLIPFSSGVSPISETVAVDAAQLAEIRAGNTYVNIHSTDFGAGEIRGQLTAVCDVSHPIADPQNGSGDAIILRHFSLRRDALQFAGMAPVDTHAYETMPAAGTGDARSLARNVAQDDTNNNADDFSSSVPWPGVHPSCNPLPVASVASEFTVQQGAGCASDLRVRAVATASDIATVYDYANADYNGDATVPSASDEATFFLHADSTTGIVSLVMVLDAINDGTGGSATVSFTDTRGTLSVAVSDDSNLVNNHELEGPPGRAIGDFSWGAAHTDGGAVTSIEWNAGACVQVSADFADGISGAVFVTENADGSQTRMPLNPSMPFEICADLCAGER